jgi:hypothetical protein
MAHHEVYLPLVLSHLPGAVSDAVRARIASSSSRQLFDAMLGFALDARPPRAALTVPETAWLRAQANFHTRLKAASVSSDAPCVQTLQDTLPKVLAEPFRRVTEDTDVAANVETMFAFALGRRPSSSAPITHVKKEWPQQQHAFLEAVFSLHRAAPLSSPAERRTSGPVADSGAAAPRPARNRRKARAADAAESDFEADLVEDNFEDSDADPEDGSGDEFEEAVRRPSPPRRKASRKESAGAPVKPAKRRKAAVKLSLIAKIVSLASTPDNNPESEEAKERREYNRRLRSREAVV